ncbi:hypothetical protein ABPG74_006559 [Tetrahymena malaccensis]
MQNNISANSFGNIKEVTKVINSLRDFKIESDIELPKIVVVGVQSSGKSSLLEQIVQIDFLPRGTGVVTRCPLEIRLIEERNQNQNFKPYAYFFQEVDNKYEDFEEVKQRIQTITKQKAGNGKQIVDDMITLTIVQTKCPTLTLIDLPGMTLNSTEDQVNVQKITEDMTLKYINQESTIILCVIPINQDLENSLALKHARDVDRNGKRTIGVLTMIDIMNPGTDCEKVLKNEQIRLQHGYYGMKPRNQNDINDNITVDQAIQIEQEYFSNHKIYNKFSQRTGTSALTRKLSELLEEHIRRFLPSIFKKIEDTLNIKKQDLEKLGEPFPTDLLNQQKELTEIIKNILDYFKKIIQGIHHVESKEIEQIKVGERIGRCYIDFLMDDYYRLNQIQFVNSLKEHKLEEVNYKLKQFRIPVKGFIPFEAFQFQIRQSICKYEQQANQLLENIKEYVKKISKTIKQQIPNDSLFGNLSNIKTQNINSINQLSIFDIINKPECIKGKIITKQESSDIQTIIGEKYDNEEVMRFCIIFYEYLDNFTRLCDKLFKHIVDSIFKNEDIETLENYLKEDPIRTLQRKDTKQSEESLQKAFETLKYHKEKSFFEVRSFNKKF